MASRDQVLALAAQGIHAAEIARRVGISRERVRQILNRYGVKAGVYKRQPLLDSIPDEELFGNRGKVVAARYNLPLGTVYWARYMRRHACRDGKR